MGETGHPLLGDDTRKGWVSQPLHHYSIALENTFGDNGPYFRLYCKITRLCVLAVCYPAQHRIRWIIIPFPRVFSGGHQLVNRSLIGCR